MRLRLKCRVALGSGLVREGRSRQDRDEQEELRDRQHYQRCGGGRRVIRKKIGGA